MSAHITLRDLARKTGFSLSTVSAALNNDARVRAVTRELVQAVAARVGYVPDPALKALSSYRWRHHRAREGMTLAYISGWPAEWATHSSHVMMIEAMRRRSEELGYRFYSHRLQELGPGDRAHRILMNRGTTGLLIGPIMDEAHLAGFDWSSFAAVAVDLGHYRPPLPLVSSNPLAAIQVAWPRVLASGRERIGVVLAPDLKSEFFNVQRAALLRFQAALPRGVPHIPQHDFRGLQTLARWIKRFRPNAIIGWSEWLGTVLRDLGYRIPEDIAFVTLRKDFKEYPDVLLHPEIAGMVQASDRIGTVAVDQTDLLVRQNQRGLSSPRVSIYVDLAWHSAASLPTPEK